MYIPTFAEYCCAHKVSYLIKKLQMIKNRVISLGVHFNLCYSKLKSDY